MSSSSAYAHVVPDSDDERSGVGRGASAANDNDNDNDNEESFEAAYTNLGASTGGKDASSSSSNSLASSIAAASAAAAAVAALDKGVGVSDAVNVPHSHPHSHSHAHAHAHQPAPQPLSAQQAEQLLASLRAAHAFNTSALPAAALPSASASSPSSAVAGALPAVLRDQFAAAFPHHNQHAALAAAAAHAHQQHLQAQAQAHQQQQAQQHQRQRHKQHQHGHAPHASPPPPPPAAPAAEPDAGAGRSAAAGTAADADADPDADADARADAQANEAIAAAVAAVAAAAAAGVRGAGADDASAGDADAGAEGAGTDTQAHAQRAARASAAQHQAGPHDNAEAGPSGTRRSARAADRRASEDKGAGGAGPSGSASGSGSGSGAAAATASSAGASVAVADGQPLVTGPGPYTFPSDLSSHAYADMAELVSSVQNLANRHGFRVTRQNMRRAGAVPAAKKRGLKDRAKGALGRAQGAGDGVVEDGHGGADTGQGGENGDAGDADADGARKRARLEDDFDGTNVQNYINIPANDAENDEDEEMASMVNINGGDPPPSGGDPQPPTPAPAPASAPTHAHAPGVPPPPAPAPGMGDAQAEPAASSAHGGAVPHGETSAGGASSSAQQQQQTAQLGDPLDPDNDPNNWVRVVYFACSMGTRQRQRKPQGASTEIKARRKRGPAAHAEPLPPDTAERPPADGALCQWQLKADRKSLAEPFRLTLLRPHHNHDVRDAQDSTHRPVHRLQRDDKARVWDLYFRCAFKPRDISAALTAEAAAKAGGPDSPEAYQILARQVEDFIYNWKAQAPAHDVREAEELRRTGADRWKRIAKDEQAKAAAAKKRVAAAAAAAAREAATAAGADAAGKGASAAGASSSSAAAGSSSAAAQDAEPVQVGGTYRRELEERLAQLRDEQSEVMQSALIIANPKLGHRTEGLDPIGRSGRHYKGNTLKMPGTGRAKRSDDADQPGSSPAGSPPVASASRTEDGAGKNANGKRPAVGDAPLPKSLRPATARKTRSSANDEHPYGHADADEESESMEAAARDVRMSPQAIIIPAAAPSLQGRRAGALGQQGEHRSGSASRTDRIPDSVLDPALAAEDDARESATRSGKQAAQPASASASASASSGSRASAAGVAIRAGDMSIAMENARRAFRETLEAQGVPPEAITHEMISGMLLGGPDAETIAAVAAAATQSHQQQQQQAQPQQQQQQQQGTAAQAEGSAQAAQHAQQQGGQQQDAAVEDEDELFWTTLNEGLHSS